MLFADTRKNYFRKFVIAALTVFPAVLFSASRAEGRTVIVNQNSAGLGIIKGIVRDGDGSPIAAAYISIFRAGTSKLLKQVRSTTDGSFLAKIIPGTYTVLAVAEGFNPISIAEVEVNRAAELSYGFNLERAGQGNTLPEKRLDRSSPRIRVRAAQSQRSIYQNQEGDAPIDETATAQRGTTDEVEIAGRQTESEIAKPLQTVVETYFAGSNAGSYTGVNFATLLPVSENTEIVFAGQTGTKNAPQRFETNLKYTAGANHSLHFKTAVGSFGTLKTETEEKSLGQVSLQAFDEWQVKNGVILVLGFDYSRFVGAGNDSALSPRLGLQFDVNSKTRVRTALTEKTEEKDWARAADLEGTSAAFSEPAAIEDFTLRNNKPQLNKSRRMEFGIERVLDSRSTVEANAFFDLTPGRGVGLVNLPFASLGNESLNRLTGNQAGKAQGVRLVYSRRLNSVLTGSAGYAFGSGQKLSGKTISNPNDVFENALFQSFYGQIDANFKTGTNIKTIFRLSPEATVFAIDPFQGRLAIYDPSLSVFITQSLPNLGLPFRAEAIVDARNLFDFQTSAGTSEGTLQLLSQRRTVRGGILVRF